MLEQFSKSWTNLHFYSPQDSRFLVCKHQLSHSSDFFRTLFLNSYALPMEGVRHVGEDEYVVQVTLL